MLVWCLILDESSMRGTELVERPTAVCVICVSSKKELTLRMRCYVPEMVISMTTHAISNPALNLNSGCECD
jgi:hypothetical protein